MAGRGRGPVPPTRAPLDFLPAIVFNEGMENDTPRYHGAGDGIPRSGTGDAPVPHGKSYTCADCASLSCTKADRGAMPRNCPVRDEALVRAALAEYDAHRDFYVTASGIEKAGYCRWPRLRETVELCRRMGYERVGLAFCDGLRREAGIVAHLLREAGFTVVSVVCKAGGVDKCAAGISEEDKLRPGGFEPMCNPILQAMALNRERTQLNIVLGLCVGHDSLFYRYSDALTTTLVAKDRALMHNPAAAIYGAEGYCRGRLHE